MQLVSKDTKDPGTELQREVWLFVTAAVVLTGFTLAVTFWWERQERKVAAPVVAQMALQAGVKREPKVV